MALIAETTASGIGIMSVSVNGWLTNSWSQNLVFMAILIIIPLPFYMSIPESYRWHLARGAITEGRESLRSFWRRFYSTHAVRDFGWASYNFKAYKLRKIRYKVFNADLKIRFLLLLINFTLLFRKSNAPLLASERLVFCNYLLNKPELV